MIMWLITHLTEKSMWRRSHHNWTTQVQPSHINDNWTETTWPRLHDWDNSTETTPLSVGWSYTDQSQCLSIEYILLAHDMGTLSKQLWFIPAACQGHLYLRYTHPRARSSGTGNNHDNSWSAMWVRWVQSSNRPCQLQYLPSQDLAQPQPILTI